MGATTPFVGVAVSTLMIVLFCLMVAALVYVIAIGALASFFDFDARWVIALLTDFTINVIVIGTNQPGNNDDPFANHVRDAELYDL
ncbi:hypothetical protein Tco_0405484 [Tanacetum coccineum]